MTNAVQDLYLQSMLQRERERGRADALALRRQAADLDGTAVIAQEYAIPAYQPGDYTDPDRWPIGSPVTYDGQVYKLWQHHDATGQPDWTPDKAVSLWDICHTKDPATAKDWTPPQGTRGQWQVDEVCVQLGHIWRNTYANNDRSPEEMPDRWEDLGETWQHQPWAERPLPELPPVEPPADLPSWADGARNNI